MFTDLLYRLGSSAGEEWLKFTKLEWMSGVFHLVAYPAAWPELDSGTESDPHLGTTVRFKPNDFKDKT